MSMRQRQEIQKVLWRLSVTLVIAGASLQGALLPESFAEYKRGAVAAVTPEDPAVWSEYGLESAEKAEYSGPASFSVTAWRLKDPTGAFAAFQWQRPANAQGSTTSASTGNESLVLHNNYLLRVERARLKPEALAGLYAALPNQVSTSLPPLYGFLPARGRVANSERYLLGTSSLSRFEPRIPAGLAAFDRGAEGQAAKYRTGGTEVQMTIISYPTPQMAIERARAFASLAGAAVKRSGPLLAVIPEAAGQSAADKLLAEVSYNPNFTWNEYVPKHTTQDAARMILAISVLAAGLIVASLVMGLFFGGSKVLAKRFGMSNADEGFTSLHLDRK
jgi:hypothetical protein